MHILFIDHCCRAPYNDDSLDAGIGGSEASVVHLSRALEDLGHRTTVVQAGRTTSDGRFSGTVPSRAYEHVVVLRDPRPIALARPVLDSLSPGRTIPITLWVHDSATPEAWGAAAVEMLDMHPIVVVPSEYQRTRFEFAYRHVDDDKRFPLHVIPNPVAVPDLDPHASTTARQTDFNKLMFASDPDRGLVRAIQLLMRTRREGRPGLKLHVCRPSYASPLTLGRLLAMIPAAREAVVDLGVVSHARVLEEMATAACLFYPNASVPEAFGLVMAEANALGVPVLTHDLGAAREVVSPAAGQIISMEPDTIIEHLLRLTDPRAVRPSVSLKPEFTVDAVAARWVEHFKKYSAWPSTQSSVPPPGTNERIE